MLKKAMLFSGGIRLARALAQTAVAAAPCLFCFAAEIGAAISCGNRKKRLLWCANCKFALVVGGRNSPPDCFSVPPLFESFH